MSKTTTQGGMEGSGKDIGISYSQLYGSKIKAKYSFRFKGLVEFTYQDNTVMTSINGKKQKSGWTSFGQRYKLGGHGFIVHPKLLQYYVNIGFDWNSIKYDSGNGSLTSKDISYGLGLTFLPNRPITLEIDASKTRYSGSSGTSSTNDSVSTSFGARLVSTIRSLPLIRIEYSHWDYSSERLLGTRFYDEWEEKFIIVTNKVTDKTINDRFNIYVNGRWRPLKTRYTLSSGIVKFTNPRRTFDMFYARGNFNTQFAVNHSLWTYFQYQKIDTTKLLDISFDYKPVPIKNIYHNYGFEYMNSESPTSKTNAYIFSGLWRYRFSPRANVKADIRYRLGTKDGDDDRSFKLETSANYGRPLKIFDFNTQYNFFIARETNSNDFSFMQNRLYLSLSTRKYRWGKIYSNYEFLYNNFNFKFSPTETSEATSQASDEIQHRLRLGAKVSGPLRASWSVELEARYLDASGDNTGAWQSVWIGANQWAQKIRHYTATADLRFPVGRKGSITLSGSYTTGETNSEPIKKYDYQARFNYNIIRNLRFSGWWRVEWRSAGWWSSGSLINVDKQFYTDTRTRDYQFNLDYAWRRLFFSLEYASTLLEEGTVESEATRMYLRVSRPF
jgi:hypothetical protein